MFDFIISVKNTDLFCLGNESSLYLHTKRILHSTSWLHLHFSFARNSLNINQSDLEIIQKTISVTTVVNLTCFLTRMCRCLIRTRA